MRIGIDMDDTICCTKESIIKYQELFIKENNLNYNELWNNPNNKEKFLNTYLKDIYTYALPKENVVEKLKELKNKNHELYIITARTDKYINNQIKLIDDYLYKYNIKVDKIYINANDKVDICLKEKIDIMIDDSLYNYKKLKENNIKVILLDENNTNINIKERITSWNDIYKFL